MSDFGETRWQRAAKSHRCEWCGETIKIGVKHAKYVGVWEGDFQNWRMHSECLTAADGSGELSEGFSPYEHERPRADLVGGQGVL